MNSEKRHTSNHNIMYFQNMLGMKKKLYKGSAIRMASYFSTVDLENIGANASQF